MRQGSKISGLCVQVNFLYQGSKMGLEYLTVCFWYVTMDFDIAHQGSQIPYGVCLGDLVWDLKCSRKSSPILN